MLGQKQMPKPTGRILKSDNVKLEGLVHLDAAQPGISAAQKRTAALAAPQARIVENQSEFAVIEITCCCGAKMHLRCEYGGAEPPNNGS